MKIRMLKIAAGPLGVYPKGSIQELDAVIAGRLLEVGAAERVGPVEKPIETTTVEPRTRTAFRRISQRKVDDGHS
jgi:hypothetical protein